LLRESCIHLRGVGRGSYFVAPIWFSGVLAIQRGSLQRGARLLAAGTPPRDHPRFALAQDRRTFAESIESARASLGDAEFERAWAEGQAMTLDEAVDYALGDDS
jgi:hypothetical protein